MCRQDENKSSSHVHTGANWNYWLVREKNVFFGVAKSMAIKTCIWDLGNFSGSLVLISCIFYSDWEVKLGPHDLHNFLKQEWFLSVGWLWKASRRWHERGSGEYLIPRTGLLPKEGQRVPCSRPVVLSSGYWPAKKFIQTSQPSIPDCRIVGHSSLACSYLCHVQSTLRFLLWEKEVIKTSSFVTWESAFFPSLLLSGSREFLF